MPLSSVKVSGLNTADRAGLSPPSGQGQRHAEAHGRELDVRSSNTSDSQPWSTLCRRWVITGDSPSVGGLPAPDWPEPLGFGHRIDRDRACLRLRPLHQPREQRLARPGRARCSPRRSGGGSGVDRGRRRLGDQRAPELAAARRQRPPSPVGARLACSAPRRSGWRMRAWCASPAVRRPAGFRPGPAAAARSRAAGSTARG